MDIIFTFLRRTTDHDDEFEDYFDDDIVLPQNEEYIHEIKVCLFSF
jgi:hypothetical protein